MKLSNIFLLLFLSLNSCNEDYVSIDEYIKKNPAMEVEKITHPSGDFSLYVPKDWSWKILTFESDTLKTGMQIAFSESKKGYTNIISIEKYKSEKKHIELKDEYAFQLSSYKDNPDMELVENGQTKLNHYKTYFLHTKSNDNTSIELVEFLIQGKDNGVFYSLSANSQTNDSKLHDKNMSVMLKCLNSFEHN